jgi:hypothetical protein
MKYRFYVAQLRYQGCHPERPKSVRRYLNELRRRISKVIEVFFVRSRL